MLRSEREKQSKLQEKYQSILSSMLKEEDNKYCVDCDAKSPRWASWNIGVFLCIRCAGFHRNLGVHISKVKSVNLDSWTGEQIALLDAEPKEEKRRTEKKLENDKFEKAVSGQIPQLKPYVPQATATNPVRNVSIPTESGERSSRNKNDSNQIAEDLVKLDEPSAIVPTSSSSNSEILDPLHSLFPSNSQPTVIKDTLPSKQPDAAVTTNNFEQDLQNAFSNDKSVTNDLMNPNNSQLTKDKILALYNTPQSSITSNILSQQTNNVNQILPNNPNVIQTPSSFGARLPGFQNRPQFHQQQQQHPHPHPHHHHHHSASMPYSGQQMNFPRYSFPAQQTNYSPQGMLSKSNYNGSSSPTLQSPMQNHTNEQLNMQFRNMQPLTNVKTSPIDALVSGQPTHPTNDFLTSWNSSTTTPTNTSAIDLWQ
ncbi:unnamed protein product [Didymodactylos carnosus]|uniref:Arf-GAP domain-containing protein n=1 Tax=Didymodactylos carnosus TaxID=1234261 RepID=A0A813ZUG2_9BILA|nr:unnamed protein product [Didymodactylos carnosus]CAF3686571.1 unnamed protein product [Didymodactylos carnosus]